MTLRRSRRTRPTSHGDVTVDQIELSAELAGRRRSRRPRPSRGVRAVARRRRADPRRSSSARGSRALPSSRRTSRSATSPSTCSATPARCCATPARSTAAPRTTSPTGATSREFRCAWLFEQPNGDFAQTIARQLAASVYQFELYSALRASADATLAAIAAKARQGGRLPPRPRRAVDAAPRGRHRRVAATHAARHRRRLAVRRRALPRRAADRSARGAGVAVRPSDAARRLRRGHRRGVRRGASSTVPEGFVSSGGRPARRSTSRRSATCSPRCRCSRGSIRGRHGDARPVVERAQRTRSPARGCRAAPGDRGGGDRSRGARCSRSRISACCATSRATAIA